MVEDGWNYHESYANLNGDVKERRFAFRELWRRVGPIRIQERTS